MIGRTQSSCAKRARHPIHCCSYARMFHHLLGAHEAEQHLNWSWRRVFHYQPRFRWHEYDQHRHQYRRPFLPPPRLPTRHRVAAAHPPTRESERRAVADHSHRTPVVAPARERHRSQCQASASQSRSPAPRPTAECEPRPVEAALLLCASASHCDARYDYHCPSCCDCVTKTTTTRLLGARAISKTVATSSGTRRRGNRACSERAAPVRASDAATRSPDRRAECWRCCCPRQWMQAKRVVERARTTAARWLKTKPKQRTERARGETTEKRVRDRRQNGDLHPGARRQMHYMRQTMRACLFGRCRRRCRRRCALTPYRAPMATIKTMAPQTSAIASGACGTAQSGARRPNRADQCAQRRASRRRSESTPRGARRAPGW